MWGHVLYGHISSYLLNPLYRHNDVSHILMYFQEAPADPQQAPSTKPTADKATYTDTGTLIIPTSTTMYFYPPQ